MNKKVLVYAMISIVTSGFLYGASEEYSLDSVTVSANKIEEKIQDVPQSITVIDEAALEDKEIKSVADVIKEVPNLSSSYNTYAEDVNFRGINSSTFTNNNPVVLYIDGIPQSDRLGYDASLVNVDHIEVLRGPQSTLYGKDAIGGVINIVTKKPTNEWKGSVGAEYGTDNYMLGTFNINGPLVNDVLFLGFNIKASHDDGWITNHEEGMDENANEKNERRLGASLLYKPSDRLSVRLNLSSDYFKNGWLDGAFTDSGNWSSVTRDDAKNVRYEVDTYTKTESDAQALNLTYAFDTMDFTSVTTHKKVTLDGQYDFGWSANALYDNLYQFQNSSVETTSQELRLSSNTKEGIRWIGGLYAERSEYENPRYGMQYPGYYYGTSYNWDLDDVSKTTTDTQAIFGQAIIPFADKYELTLGARYQHINKDILSNMYMNPVGMLHGTQVYTIDAEHDWNALLPKAALNYKINDTWSTFASISKGYMPGGYNYWSSSSVEAENRFDPQTSMDYEIGTKASFDKLYFAATLFYMDIKDIQVYNYDSSTGMITTSNAGKAHSYGAEFEFNYLMSEQWVLDGSLGLMKAVYDEYTESAYEGHKIEKTPSRTAKIGLQYNHPQGYYARLDIRNQGTTYFNAANTFKEGSYTVGDIKLGRRFSNWDIYTYMKNMTDEEYFTTVQDQGVGQIVTFGASRTVGVGFKYTF
ncbi:TonB-dependent siderophore receptor [Sulfurospirillum sp. MES]|uniref:TonB-dependent receptor n=1 Tax=Sulfurospirillum sp. MES TaxID=1565314 RepID=UPI0005438737|nr:TonB-dependent siderophore receptor [Sulfurospirillum sp. MES]KHG34002.1 MAG: hypothetical protein OA34_06550 [Sulfurospirillum sp. MES]